MSNTQVWVRNSTPPQIIQFSPKWQLILTNNLNIALKVLQMAEERIIITKAPAQCDTVRDVTEGGS